MFFGIPKIIINALQLEFRFISIWNVLSIVCVIFGYNAMLTLWILWNNHIYGTQWMRTFCHCTQPVQNEHCTRNRRRTKVYWHTKQNAKMPLPWNVNDFALFPKWRPKKQSSDFKKNPWKIEYFRLNFAAN